MWEGKWIDWKWLGVLLRVEREEGRKGGGTEKRNQDQSLERSPNDLCNGKEEKPQEN